MFEKAKTTKMQGNIGIGEAIAYFLRSGYCVSLPINDSQEYDIVVDIDGLLSKVQVKTTKYKKDSGFYIVELRTKGGTSGVTKTTFSDSGVDYLFVLTDSGDKYFIPAIDILDIKCSFTLNNSYSKYLVR